MPTARPFAFNPGSPIAGTQQIGDIAIGTTPQNYSGGYGGVRWWNGPDEDLGYVICYSVPGEDHPSPDGPIAGVGFFRSQLLTEPSFIEIAEYVSSGQTFATGLDAKIWLNNNGYWTSYQSNLIVYLDAGNSSSYPGTGTTWFDLDGTANNATLINSPTFSSSYQGILQFDNTSLQTANIPDLGNLPNWTIEAWVRFTQVPISSNPNATTIITNEYTGGTRLNFSMGTNNAPADYNVNVGFFDGAWHNTTGFAPEANTWYQIVGTYDGATIRQYINGVASGGTLNYVGTPESGGQTLLMRRWDATSISGDYCNGDLAIVKIYDSALDAADVLSSYNATHPRFIEVTPTPTNTNTPTPTYTPTNTPIFTEGYKYNFFLNEGDGPVSPAFNGNFEIVNDDTFTVTYNPNYTGSLLNFYFNAFSSDGTDNSIAMSELATNGGTFSITQRTYTAIYSGTSGDFSFNTSPYPYLIFILGSTSQQLVFSPAPFTSTSDIYLDFPNNNPTPTPTNTSTPTNTPTNTLTPTPTPS